MERLNLTKKEKILYILTLILIVGGDQITKFLIDKNMNLYTEFIIIKNFFSFTYIHNTGAAWGMMNGARYLFIIVSVVVGVFLYMCFQKTSVEDVLTRYGSVLVFCGMFGNLIDRVVFGYVRDFLDFVIIGYDFPVFNIADMAVVVGVGLIILEILLSKEPKEELSDGTENL